jgi:hypothetical protein
MREADPQTRDLIEQARRELNELEQRLAAMRELFDRVLQPQTGATGARNKADGRFSRGQPAGTSVARSVASHMSLSGYSRERAEERLRGTVSRRRLQRILDEVYGRRGPGVRGPHY